MRGCGKIPYTEVPATVGRPAHMDDCEYGAEGTAIELHASKSNAVDRQHRVVAVVVGDAHRDVPDRNRAFEAGAYFLILLRKAISRRDFEQVEAHQLDPRGEETIPRDAHACDLLACLANEQRLATTTPGSSGSRCRP